jgi:hypothetical protein
VDTRFGTWNVRSLCKAGSLITVATETAKYKQYLVGVQEARWDRGDTEPTGECTFFYGRTENHELGKGVLYIRESHQQLIG